LLEFTIFGNMALKSATEMMPNIGKKAERGLKGWGQCFLWLWSNFN